MRYLVKLFVSIIVGLIVADQVGLPISLYLASFGWALLVAMPLALVAVFVASLRGSSDTAKMSVGAAVVYWSVIVIELRLGYTFDQIVAFGVVGAIVGVLSEWALPTRS